MRNKKETNTKTNACAQRKNKTTATVPRDKRWIDVYIIKHKYFMKREA